MKRILIMSVLATYLFASGPAVQGTEGTRSPFPVKTLRSGLEGIHVRTPRKVTAAQAEEIARAFLGAQLPMSVRAAHLLPHDEDSPPYPTPCYQFEMQVNARSRSDGDAGHEGKPVEQRREVESLDRSFTAYVQVEQSTGCVVGYDIDAGYLPYRDRLESRSAKPDLLTYDRALTLARTCIERTGIPVEGMRLSSLYPSSERYDERPYTIYLLVWGKFVDVRGIGEVEMPESVSLCMLASTGEILSVHHRKYCVDVKPVRPAISAGQAQKLALAKCKPKDVGSVRCNLMVFRGNPPKYEPAFAWHVCYYRKDYPDALVRDAVIDARTGKVLRTVKLEK
jgi:hypothetical protein